MERDSVVNTGSPRLPGAGSKRPPALGGVLLLAALVGASATCHDGAGESEPNGQAASPIVALSTAFQPQVLVPPGEAPLELRLFPAAVKTDSRGRIITGPTSDPVKHIVGAQNAGDRAGMTRYAKITFGAQYNTGQPNPSHRVDPNNPALSSGSEHWPNRPQPFRSWPNSVAITPDGAKIYVTLPGREGYPDWRVAVVDAVGRRVLRWVDVRPPEISRGTRPLGVQVSPVNTAIYRNPYAVVTNEYGNFAAVIDTATDAVLGHFQSGFYGEDLVFNSAGTRLYITDRADDSVRAFRIDPGPRFTQIAEIPTGSNDLDRANPRDLALSADGNTLFVGNTLGHTIAVINVANDADALVKNITVGGLVTDVKVAGRWGIVCGHATNNRLNGPETGHGLPGVVNGVAVKNNGQPLGYTPVMTDATRATTFDDIGSELNVFDTATGQFVYRYVDASRDKSLLVTAGQVVDLGDFSSPQKIIQGSGPEQMFVTGNFLFVSQMHSDKVEVFRINQNPSDPSQILTEVGFEFTGGITPQGIAAAPNGSAVYVANMQTEDLSFLAVNSNGGLTRLGFVPVGVTPSTPDPTSGGHGANLFATDEEAGLRWFFTNSYSDDGQKSCGFCHWQSRSDGSQWNVGANALGGVKVSPQNKDISDNWPEWFEGLNNNMNAYASACNGELVNAEKVTALFPQANLSDRLKARDNYVRQQTAANSNAIGRSDLSGKAHDIGYYDMAFLQILWSQNESRRMPNPAAQFPTTDQAAKIARGKQIFSTSVAAGGSGCSDCHRNGNTAVNGVPNDTTQDYNIWEPGVVSETTVDGNGPFARPANDYFFQAFGPLQDEGARQNISSRNTKHLRSFWDSTRRWLHHGDAHSVREVLLTPDSPLLQSGERGFNFRTVRTDHQRASSDDYLGGPVVTLPTEVPITFADSSGALSGDGKGPIYVSLDTPTAQSDGTLQIDRIGTSNLVPLVVVANGQRQINPQLAQNHIQVIKDTHGKTSHLSASDVDALAAYLLSLQ